MSVGTGKKKYVERALQGGLLTLEIVKEVSDIAGVPYLPKVAGLVLKIFEIIEAVKDNKSGFTELAKDATNILSILLDYYESRSAEAGASGWLPDSLKDVVEKLTQTLVDTIDLANKNILRPILFRMLSSKADTGDIAKLRLRIDASLKAFEVQSHLGINQKLSELMSLQLNKDAESKRAATLSRRTQVMKELGARIHKGAGFDASARSDIPKCTPQTREAILKHIQDWIENGEDMKQIMWLYGPAGSGKTTIGQTIAQLYEEYKRLLASFFFSRSAGDSRPTDNTAFVTTITLDFCISIPELTDYVGDAISKDVNIFNRNLSKQMQSLLIDSLNQLIKDRVLDESAPKNWWLVLIDGLDECDADAAQKEVLSLLLMLIQKTNLPLRVLVASRPEHAIRSFINGSKMGPLFVHNLALEADYSANEDIKTFLLSQFDAIKDTHPAAPKLPADWPHDEDVQELVTRADGLFIYASVVMKYISSEDSHPLERSKQIINSLRPAIDVSASNLPFAQLDAMYAYILSKIPPDNRQKVRDILCLRLCDNDNVKYVTDFEVLFDLQSGGLSTLLKPLAAIMTISDASWETLSFVHASFPDFLQDLSRLTNSKVPEFACILNNDTHARLALAWLRYYANIPTAVFVHHEFGDYIWASTALHEICRHCQEANLWNVLEPALQIFDIRLSFPKDLQNAAEYWLRVHYCLSILLWIRSQEHNVTARKLHDQHRQHIESALRGYWSQIPPEVQFFLPFLLLRKPDMGYNIPKNMQWLFLRLSAGTAPGRLLSEIFLGFTDKASSDSSQLKGHEQVHKFVIWSATILTERKSNHPYHNFVDPDDQPSVLAVILYSAPADLELDAFLRSSNLVDVAERKLVKPDKYFSIHIGCKNLLRAIEDYHAKCDELRTQLRTVESDSFPSDTPINGSDISNAVIQLTGISSERKSISMTATENGHDEVVLSAADGTSDLERAQSLKEPTDAEDINTVPVDILRPEIEPTKLRADGDPVGVLLIPRIQARAADGTRQIFAAMPLVVALLSYFGMMYIFEQRSA